ncbi:MAG: acyl-CoA dehydrogenase family protein [Ignavibacteria bacterium]|nr:acyl-CoA dehydrogenase family protein [Ignavibacteria bacterium]
MDFSWSEEERQLKESIIRFARRELAESAIERDRMEHFDRDLWERCARFGIPGLPFPVLYGGQGLDIFSTVGAMEGLGYACRDNGLLFGLNAQMWSVQMPIHRFGTPDQKERFLRPLCEGTLVGAHAMTEPASGSDAFSLSTTAVREGDFYRLSGSKTFVSLAPVADLFVVFATVNRKAGFLGVTAFLLERDTAGLRVGNPISKLGLRSCPWAEVFLEDCLVPLENRLGDEGAGATLFNDSMEWERGCLLAGTVGAMERQLEDCVEYAKTRRQFNSPIIRFQSISNLLVGMRLRLETSRLLLHRMASEKASGKRCRELAAMAKLHISESWKQSSLEAIQIHGGYGYSVEFEVERDFRDAIGGTIYSGTSEIQMQIIADALLG